MKLIIVNSAVLCLISCNKENVSPEIKINFIMKRNEIFLMHLEMELTCELLRAVQKPECYKPFRTAETCDLT